MNIGGKKRENTGGGDYPKKVGLFEAKVIAVNPSIEEYKSKLGIELKEDSKAVEYLGESKDGNDYLRIDFWLKEVKDSELQPFKVSFFLENNERENKDKTKKQYINNIGNCAWADSPSNLPDWFVKRDFRVANIGEEDLYEFMRVWLGDLDYRDAETVLQIEWKKLIKGNVKDIKDQINGEWSTNIVALATIVTREKDGEIKEYQNVYNKGFLPAYTLKQFRLTDYSNPKVLETLSKKASKDLKPHERFVNKVTGEYGCKDYYIFKDLEEYKTGDNFAASESHIYEEEDDDY
jgi:hypothetical protein